MADQMQEPDGSILIEARIDESEIRASLARLTLALNLFAKNASSQIGGIPGQTAAAEQGMFLAGKLLMNGLSGGMMSEDPGLSSTLKTILGGAVHGALLMRSDWEQIGGQMIGSIISGIHSAAEALWNTLSEIAVQMSAVMQSALGISSPSKVMRDTVGRNAARGIREGLLAERASTAEAARQLAMSCVVEAEALSAAQHPVSAFGAVMRSRTSGAEMIPENRTNGRFSGASLPGTPGQIPAAGQQNTFIFNKPVETPYAHAKEIRQTMEALMYGV